MQDEVNTKVIAIAIKGGKITAEVLEKALKKFVEEIEKAQKQARQPKTYRGKQSIKHLVQQNAAINNIEVTDGNIKSFQRTANKYGIDYALKKDTSEQPPRYLVFFKGRDVDVMTQAFKEFSAKTVKQSERPIFPFLGIRFKSINDHYDSAKHEGKTIGMDVAFKNLIYDYYSKDLSQKVKSAMRTKQQKARFVNTVPYGYKTHQDDKHQLVIDGRTAPVVRRIFLNVIDGKSCTQIAKELNAEGILTPAQAKAIHSSSAKKHQWTHRAILSMIENIKYTGVMANHMRESRFIRDKNQRRVPKEEWYIRKNAHEAIVTQEEFDKANEAIQRRRKTARVTHDQSDRVYYCAHCGGKLEKANGTVFACPSHRYHDGSPCEGVYWRKNALEEVLLEALKGQIEITRIESLEVKKAARIRNESLQRQLVLLKAQYDACGREKFTLYEQYREAKITAEEYLSGKDELTRKQAALKEQLEESEALYEANQQMSDAASEQQEAVGKMTGLSDAKLREHLYDAVERVLVYDSESIEIIWKFNEVKNGISSYAGAGV